MDSIPFQIKDRPEVSNYRKPFVVAENASTTRSRENSHAEEIPQALNFLLHHNLIEYSLTTPVEPTSFNMSSNQPNAALLKQIKAMINRAITAWMATPQPVNQISEQAKEADKHNSRWYAANLRFFDPKYNSKSVTTGEAMEHAGKDTIF